MAERKQKNDPGKYAADIWGTELTQTRQSTQTRRGKNGTIVIGNMSFTQDALFQGEEIRIPFPDAPVNKIPDRLGMTDAPGTLFSKPEQESQSTQAELFFIPQDAEDHTRIPLPVDPQVGKLPDDLKPFVTYVPLHLLSAEQRKQGVNVKSIVSRALLAKLSHLLANQPVRTLSPASVNSAESENSHLP